MALGWSDAAKLQIAGSTVRVALLMRVDSTPAMRLWAGIGDFLVPADLIEEEDAIYEGLGHMLNLPVVQQLINGVAERVEFTVSGVSAEAMSLAMGDADTVRGASTLIGFCALDGDWQRASPTAWLWEGAADVVKVLRSADNGSITRTISLSVGSLFTARQRPRLGYWTDAQQRRRSPDDAGCDHVATYNPGSTKRFKPRS